MISVVIPTHCRPDFLARLLRSIAAQTLAPQEVIVVDDASPDQDEYLRVISSFKPELPQLVYVSLPANQGAPAARNEGIRRARGEWVALVDDDDEWLAEKLQRQAEVAQRVGREVALIYGWTRVVDAQGNVVSESRPSVEGKAASAIFRTNFIMSPSVMVRREVLMAVGLFDESFPSCQDWDMWARVLAAGFQCKAVKEFVAVYHKHGMSSVGLSPKALQGYRLFLRKHWQSVMRYTGPLNWLKKLKVYLDARE